MSIQQPCISLNLPGALLPLLMLSSEFMKLSKEWSRRTLLLKFPEGIPVIQVNEKRHIYFTLIQKHLNVLPTCLESIFASSLAFRIKLTIHLSASSGVIFNFSASILILIHWWMRQNVSKINSRAFSIKSSKQAIKKKSLRRTYKGRSILICLPNNMFEFVEISPSLFLVSDIKK